MIYLANSSDDEHEPLGPWEPVALSSYGENEYVTSADQVLWCRPLRQVSS